MMGASRVQPETGMRPPPPPPEVAGFVIHSFVGRGSSGVVWRATQEGTMREVALKVLAPWQAHGLAPLRFEREAEIAASLEHEAIARVFGAGECGVGPWLAMELVDGPPADVWVREKQPPLRERVAFFRRVCAGMSHAHQRGVIHRDLKPGNVLVTAQGQPKIVDFGLARRDAPSSLELSLTREGDFLGTLAWMPPEQASGQWSEVDALSDVFALGAILFGLVVEVPPLDGGLPPSAQLAAAQAGERRRLREVDPSAPRDLEAVVARCLAAGKSQRYQSVAELEDDVGRWLAGEPVRAPVGAPLYWARKKLRRHWPAVAAVVVGGLSAVGVAAGYWQGRERVEAEKTAALRREAEQRKRTLHEAQELVTQLLVEMRPKFEQAGHPEWIEEAERRVAAFPWDVALEGAYDSRRFRGRTALVLGDTLAGKGQWGNALEAYHDAIAQYQPLVEERPEVDLFREELMRARLGESKSLLKLDYHKEAYHAAQRLLALTDPGAGQPATRAISGATIDAVEQLVEATLRMPEHAGESMEIARRTLGQVEARNASASPSLIGTQDLARVLLQIARLSSKWGERAEAHAAATRAEAAARQLAEISGQGEVSGRLLASALVMVAEGALKDGDAVGSCRVLSEASERLGRSPIPVGISLSAYRDLALAWETCGSYIATHHDAKWAIEANERAVKVWGQIRKREPTGLSMVALSRLCLANLKLALKSGDTTAAARYGLQTASKFPAGLADGTARASVALDAIEASLCMIETGVPDPPNQPAWRNQIIRARQWLEETKPRMTKETIDRPAALAARIERALGP